MGKLKGAVLFAAIATTCSSCGGGTQGAGLAAPGAQQLRFEKYCSIAGLGAPLRQTFVVIDASVVSPVEEAAEFSTLNADLRDVVMAFANPGAALDAGRSAPRERITLLVAQNDGSAPRQAFTGCLPGFSSEERATMGAGESKVSSFFTGGFQQDLADDVEQFRAMVAGALIQTARSVPPGDSPSSNFFSSLSALGQVFRSTEAVPRIVLVSDSLAGAPQATLTEARRRGFEDARAFDVDLGNSEVLVVGEGGSDENSRGYLESMLLAMNGHLGSWSRDAGGLQTFAPPVSLARYSGTAAYPDGSDQVIQIRMAQDANGKLVNSWLVLLGIDARAIPLQGQAVCSGNAVCEVRSEQGGFAQAWVADRGADPVFDNDAPFGGMREWRMTTQSDALEGEVFDSAVMQVGATPGQRSISIRASLQQKANF